MYDNNLLSENGNLVIKLEEISGSRVYGNEFYLDICDGIFCE